MAGICLPLGLCKGTFSGLWKMVEIPIGPTIHCNWGNPNLYLNQPLPITKGWCQPIGSHVSYPTNSPTSTRLRLFSSLYLTRQMSTPPQMSCCRSSNIQGPVAQTVYDLIIGILSNFLLIFFRSGHNFAYAMAAQLPSHEHNYGNMLPDWIIEKKSQSKQKYFSYISQL